MSETRTIQVRNPEESGLSAGLYLVPTPIGNLRDITLRALDVLTGCDAMICEDSRVTGKLLKAYDLPSKKKIIYNDHADEAAKNHIIDLIHNGHVLAMVSDAGTPLISDPGYKLVRACISQGLNVTALPGANAVLPALQLSGMPSDSFTFAGFMPSKDKAVRDVIDHYATRRETILFYDSPKRIEKTVQIIAEIVPDREVAVIREISKLYEQAIVKSARDMVAHLAANPVKGEIVLVLRGAERQQIQQEDLEKLIIHALTQGEGVKAIASRLSQETGVKKKDIYDYALRLKDTLPL